MKFQALLFEEGRLGLSSVLRSNQSLFSIKDDCGMFGAGGTMMQIKWCISILPGERGSLTNSAGRWVVSITALDMKLKPQNSLHFGWEGSLLVVGGGWRVGHQIGFQRRENT